ncbi:hypothetical protein U7230_05880 [Carboxydochorda subterranea]|uniref:Uncharacterized protein n=1 Tax=Carboxydichorda subterranea TaxID=3109565 RepID=A0ABZ1C1A1_9FIRM|nr:hypothetical protein [Limnochorda sp. L945t]WRP18531.1 hypothetical protein U7230_05880 [Limnochorda sp. L945t]
MPGAQKNIRLSRRALELLRALKYVFDAGDNLVIEAALNEAAEHLLLGCAQRLRMAEKGLVPQEEVQRLRAEATVLVQALNVEAGKGWPPYRIEGNDVARQDEDGTWRSLGAPDEPIPHGLTAIPGGRTAPRRMRAESPHRPANETVEGDTR